MTLAGGSVQRIASGRLAPALLPDMLLQRWARSSGDAGGRFETAQGPAAYRLRRVSDASGTPGALVTVTLPAAALREIDELTSVALSVTLATILLGSLAAFLIAGRLLGPMRQLTATAHTIGIHVSGSGHTIRSNIARNNDGWGIFAAPGNVDGGGNRASGNAEPLQCFGVRCTP